MEVFNMALFPFIPVVLAAGFGDRVGREPSGTSESGRTGIAVAQIQRQSLASFRL
jgi:hypothetical protein